MAATSTAEHKVRFSDWVIFLWIILSRFPQQQSARLALCLLLAIDSFPIIWYINVTGEKLCGLGLVFSFFLDEK